MNLNKQVLSVLKGLRNGLEYGSKVRFVHSLVISLLFKRPNMKQLINIFKLALQHGRNLGLFVLMYKSSIILLEKVVGKHQFNNFIAGFVFGGLIFGKQNPVNYQIVLYLLSRVLTALVGLAYKKYLKKRWERTEPTLQRKLAFPLMAAMCWGLVMWLFTVDKSILQSSLTSSMQFLYIESNHKLKTLLELIPYYPKHK